MAKTYGPSTKAYGGIAVDIRGMDAVQHMLDQLSDPPVKKMLQNAMSAGGKVMKPYVATEAPLGATGRLKKSVSTRRASRARPAQVVSPRPKVAFYRHFVINGTKRGMHPNPFVERGYAKGQAASTAAIEGVVNDYLDSL